MALVRRLSARWDRRLDIADLRWAIAEGREEEREAGVVRGGIGGGRSADDGGASGGADGGSSGMEDVSGVVVSGDVDVTLSIRSLAVGSSRRRCAEEAKLLPKAALYDRHPLLARLSCCCFVLHCSHVHGLNVLPLAVPNRAIVVLPTCTAREASLTSKEPYLATGCILLCPSKCTSQNASNAEGHSSEL